MCTRMGKKRKAETDLEVERSLYTSFVAAATAVSQLYTQGVQQHRKSTAQGARQALERVLCFVLREYGQSEAVPVPILLQYLQHEYESVDGAESNQMPVQMFPTAPVHTGHEEQQADILSKFLRPPLSSPQNSPARRPMQLAQALPAVSEDMERSYDMEVPGAGQLAAQQHLQSRNQVAAANHRPYDHLSGPNGFSYM